MTISLEPPPPSSRVTTPQIPNDATSSSIRALATHVRVSLLSISNMAGIPHIHRRPRPQAKHSEFLRAIRNGIEEVRLKTPKRRNLWLATALKGHKQKE